MAAGYSTTLRNSRMTAVRDAIDAGSGAGKVRVYNTSRPATGGTESATPLCIITLNDPCGTVASGVLTFTLSPTVQDTSAEVSGVPTWARITDSADAFVADVSAGVGSGDLNFTAGTVAGQPVTVQSFSITEGNP